MDFSAKTVRDATAALQKYVKKLDSESTEEKKSQLFDQENDDPAHTVYIHIITKKYAANKKSLKPRRILLPKSIYSNPSDVSICLICKDPQRTYKDALLTGDIPNLKRIIGLSKFKGKFKSYESRRLLRSEYDIFLADDNVVTGLPKLLGKIFYESKKIPLAVKISEDKLKVKKRIDDIINSTTLQLVPGTAISIKVGLLSFTAEEIAQNITAVVNYFTEKCTPLTGIRSIQLRTANSPSLPIFLTDKLHDEKDILPENTNDKKRKREEKKESVFDQATEDILADEELQEYRAKHKKEKVTKKEGRKESAEARSTKEKPVGKDSIKNELIKEKPAKSGSIKNKSPEGKVIKNKSTADKAKLSSTNGKSKPKKAKNAQKP